MKALSILVVALGLVITTAVFAQSGRKSTKPLSTTPPVVSDPNEPAEKAVTPPARDRAEVAAVAGEEYKCMDDGSLSGVVHSDEAEQVFAPNEVTTKAVIRFRPKPEYTSEARRKAVEGTITLRAVLAATGKVYSVKIINKGLPFGLNESAVHAACKIEFTPAAKDGQPVSQSSKIEYPFRLESSIFRR